MSDIDDEMHERLRGNVYIHMRFIDRKGFVFDMMRSAKRPPRTYIFPVPPPARALCFDKNEVSDLDNFHLEEIRFTLIRESPQFIEGEIVGWIATYEEDG